MDTPEARRRTKAPGEGGSTVALGTIARDFLKQVRRTSRTDGEVTLKYRPSEKGWAYMRLQALRYER